MQRSRVIAALVAFGAGSLLPAPAFAHDFWIDLDRWTIASSTLDADARFLVGHVVDQNDWPLTANRVVMFKSVAPDGAVADQRARLSFMDASRGGGAALDFAGDGVHVIAFESNYAASDLPADEFNAYLVEEGLAAVARARAPAAKREARGREIYSRRAKALVKLGEGRGALPPALGLTLEIVPLDNPYALAAGDPLRVRVDYKGRPLAGASVSLQSLSVSLLPKARQMTDANGVTVFPFPQKGGWKLNVVWSEPVVERQPEFPEAEFETVFSSLTFGY